MLFFTPERGKNISFLTWFYKTWKSLIQNPNVISFSAQAANSVGFGKETERSMVMTKNIFSNIPSSHESLITWAYDHGYHPVTSYTKAPVANRFHLRLEDTGKSGGWLVSSMQQFS